LDSARIPSRRAVNRLLPMLTDMYATTPVTASPDSTTVIATVRHWSEARQNRTTRSMNARNRSVGKALSARARTVTDPAHGCHDLGAVGVFLDLRAQPLNVHVDESRVRLVVVAPHLLEQHLAREHLLRFRRECEQQFEFEWGEVDLGVAAA